MTQFLRNALGAEDPMFSHAIKTLESMTGQRSLDITYSTDIMSRARMVMKLLGLDPKDTTAKELYHALDAQYKNDNLFEGLDDVVVHIDGDYISLNGRDVVANHGAGYIERRQGSVREAIYQELVKRYAEHHASKAAVIDVLEHAGIGKHIIRKEKKS